MHHTNNSWRESGTSKGGQAIPYYKLTPYQSDHTIIYSATSHKHCIDGSMGEREDSQEFGIAELHSEMSAGTEAFHGRNATSDLGGSPASSWSEKWQDLEGSYLPEDCRDADYFGKECSDEKGRYDMCRLKLKESKISNRNLVQPIIYSVRLIEYMDSYPLGQVPSQEHRVLKVTPSVSPPNEVTDVVERGKISILRNPETKDPDVVRNFREDTILSGRDLDKALATTCRPFRYCKPRSLSSK